MTKRYWLPTRPYTLLDAVNRIAAATGSLRYAAAASGADYNGHRVDFTPPNKFKRNWTCTYMWAGLHTLGRGSLESCLLAAKREYDRGALGASAYITVESEEDARLCEAQGFVEWSPEIEAQHLASFMDERYAKINEAREYEKWGLWPGAVQALLDSATVEEWLMGRRKPQNRVGC